MLYRARCDVKGRKRSRVACYSCGANFVSGVRVVVFIWDEGGVGVRGMVFVSEKFCVVGSVEERVSMV